MTHRCSPTPAAGHRGLYWLAVGMAPLALVLAGLAVVDQRRWSARRSGSSR